MKKSVWLAIGAVVLVGVVAFAIWYINEEGKMRTGSKDAFIPYNSALVITVNQALHLTPEVENAWGKKTGKVRRHLTQAMADTLRQRGLVVSYPYVRAMRVEGKSDVTSLYVMDPSDVLSRNEVPRCLNQLFAAGKENVRKYDRHKIYTVKRNKEVAYFAVCGGIVLISDSELYIEDGLKQFDREEAGEGSRPHYRNLSKYFSAAAGVNILLNTAAFTDLLPLYVQARKIFPHLDPVRFFKWGALDGDFREDGICLNGFLDFSGLEKSYIRTLAKQQPREALIDGIVPSHLTELGMLNLSQPSAYFAALEEFRYSTGRKNAVYDRKQQFAKMFGKDTEAGLQNLLQGEFAIAGQSFNQANGEKEGLIIVALKSGSLGKILLERMMNSYARFDNNTVDTYRREYSIDRDKAFVYYRFPVDDFAAVYWGYLFEGIKSRYVLIEDNYLVLASSEQAVKSFLKDYVHGSFVRDAEWYQHLKAQLAAKSNLCYFARTSGMLPEYQQWMKPDVRKYIKEHTAALELFPALALQWSNEGGMLYNTLFLSTETVEDEGQAHILWQTKLDAPVTMKPVPVINHITRERELFVQDNLHNVYLINDAGRILWKLPVEGRINSEVYQVDVFKNGKLQYLFSTPRRMYLLDRNGNHVGKFPVAFRSACEQGITLFDYDRNRNYRIFAPCADRRVYLYDGDGKIVEGWKPAKTDKPVVSKVQHFRVEGKDYIVFADRYRLYILDRKGKERTRVATVFDLLPHTDIYPVKRNGQTVLLFAGTGGTVHWVNFNGQSGHFKVEGLSGQFRMNVADMDGDGREECIFVDGNRLKICGPDGRVILEKTIEAGSLDYPYVYRFSAADVRLGLADSVQNRMFLLTAGGNVSKGFPISGDSPFSIVFSGSDGFFLFAGADQGAVIKYKVQK